TFAERAHGITAFGFPVIPLRPKTKIAFLNGWENLATTDEAQIAQWDAENPNYNCGAVAKQDIGWIWDVDNPVVFERMEKDTGHTVGELDTLIVKSSGEKRHFYFKHDDCSRVMGNRDCDIDGKEAFSVRAHNKYVVAAGSLHPNTGEAYEIVESPFGEIPVAPPWLTDWIMKQKSQPQTPATNSAEVLEITEGGRDKWLFAQACKLRDDRYPQKTVLNLLRGLNKECCKPPMSDSDVKKKAESAFLRGPRGEAENVAEGEIADEKRPGIITPTWVEPMRDEAFYGLAGEFVRRVEPETEADRHALLANFLVMAGVQFGRNAFAVADGKRHYPNEFVLLVGESGAGGRKGTATDRTLPVFYRVDEHFYDHILNGLSTGEGLIKATEPQTYEEVSLCRSYLVVLSEYASLLEVMKREGSTMSAVLRNAWDTAKLVVLTRKDPLKVDNVNLSLVAHITPSELLNSLNATERANGFANRHLVVAVRRSKMLPEGGNDVDVNDIVSGLHNAVMASRNHDGWDGKVSRDAEAKALWAKTYPHLTRTRAGLSGALLSRAEAHVLRLSLLYALLDSAREVRVEHLKAALAFWDYCEASVGQIFGGSSGDPLGDKILGFMAECPDGFALPTDISVGVFHRNKEADWIHAKMDALVRTGKITPVSKQIKGSSGNGWRLVKTGD
ncbi:MAG: bifunctional DNA primase/polymerase, partial [Candidatus Acidiferrales bacterium]